MYNREKRIATLYYIYNALFVVIMTPLLYAAVKANITSAICVYTLTATLSLLALGLSFFYTKYLSLPINHLMINYFDQKIKVWKSI